MILTVRYTVKGIKKGHKKYKEHKAEKERKMLEERGQIPDIQDPSRELDTSCLAETDLKLERSSSSASAGSSRSTGSAEKALENDPAFKEYMARHRHIYLQQQRENSQPPSYNSTMQNDLTTSVSIHSPAGTELSSVTSHCSCHDCVAVKRRSGQQSPIPEASTPRNSQYLLSPQAATTSRSELAPASPLRSPSRTSIVIEADSTPLPFELPGNMPAILPNPKEVPPSELPA